MDELIRMELIDAIERIENGAVTSSILLARKHRGKPIKLNYSTVSIESGRSRTLIGHPGCAYDDVRKMITNAMNSSVSDKESDVSGISPKSMLTVIKRLRVEKALLKKEKSQLASELAAARKTINLIRQGDARREYDRKRTGANPSSSREDANGFTTDRDAARRRPR